MSALMDGSAARNSLQAVKTVFGLPNLFTVGCGKGLEKARLLHYKIQNAERSLTTFPILISSEIIQAEQTLPPYSCF